MALNGAWEGTVLVCAKVANDGDIQQAQIMVSSGISLLDEEALQRIQDVKRFDIDPPLNGPSFTTFIPINYRLEIPALERTVGLNAWQQLTKTAQRSVVLLAADLKGTAIWRVTLDMKGYIVSMELDRSSGHDQLDEAAKNIIIESAPFPVHSVDPQNLSVLIVPIGFNPQSR